MGLKEEMGITASKEGSFSDWYAQVVQKAELADYAPVKGMIVLRPDGYSIWESLKARFDEKFSRRGVRNGFLPVLIPESLLRMEKSHFTGFDPEVFWVTHSGSSKLGDRLVLRPTSETLAYAMYAKWIQSWRDLPLRINFWNTALRAEIKATKPFLRTSEFLWQEGHTVHATAEEAEQEAREIMGIYAGTVEQELAIPVVTGRKSEKEKFVGAVYTLTMEAVMPDGKALQMGTSHFLGQNFAKPFGVKFSDRDNTEHLAWQTSWGVSWRLIGAMIMVHGDDQGLVLPPRVAPTQAVIVPIYGSGAAAEEVLSAARSVLATLEKDGIRAHLDDREGFSPGYKFNHWEMKGVPLRIEIGPKDVKSQSVLMVKRYNAERIRLGLGSLSEIGAVLEGIQSGMLEKARIMASGKATALSDYAKLREQVQSGGFFAVPWCGSRECEAAVKEETGADIRVIPDDGDGWFPHVQHPLGGTADTAPGDGGAKCIYCGSRATSRPIVARGY